ncbi:MAG: DUF2069 domain-containing protein [Gammaproteobacteria bacterium]|jgi:uncharacterized membrane protein
MCCRRGWYSLTLAGYFGTFILLTAWYTVLAPAVHFPVALVLLVLVSPLLFPLRGLLHGRTYTFSWSCFLALLYFTHGIVEAWISADTRVWGLMEAAFTTLWFGSAIMYVRVGREMEDR